MRKKYIIILSLIGFIVLLGSIISIVKTKNSNKKVDEQITTFIMADTYSDSGIIANDEGVINFTDIKSGATTALCDKPNCKHNTEECNAFVGETDVLAIYNNKLYFIQSVKGEKTFSKFLFQSDLNGGNRKRVAEIQDVSSIFMAKFNKDKLILNTIQNANSETFLKLENPVVGLVYIDLDNYDVKYIFKSDKYSSNIRTFEYSEEDNKILYALDYINKSKDEIGNEEVQFDEINYSEIYKNTVSELYSYDLNTKEVKLEKQFNTAYITAISKGKALVVNIEPNNNSYNVLVKGSLIYNYKDKVEKEVKAVNADPFGENGKQWITWVYNENDDTNTFYSLDIEDGSFDKLIKRERTVFFGISSNYVYISMKNKSKDNEDWIYAIEVQEFLKKNLSSGKPMKKAFND